MEMQKSLEQELVELRRDFHQNPELSWQEVRTQGKVLEYLRKLGIEAEPACGTGVVATIRGQAHPSRILGIRADMDALKIQEETGLSYASRVPGVMHACGHDAHTAILLGTARVLWEKRKELKGTVRLIFQPAEEYIQDSGAGHMKELESVRECERMLALHVWGTLPVGWYSLREGSVMASADTFDVWIHGKGGHGAHPDRAIDPIAAGVAYCQALNQMMAREFDGLDSAVLSVTCFHGGTAPNVIPESVRLSGTCRALTEEIRERFPGMLQRAAAGVGLMSRTDIQVDYHWGCPPMINHPEAVRTGRKAALKTFGEGRLLDLEPQMGGEDFSKYEAPKALLILGAAVGEGHAQHDPRHEIDERALGLGVSYFVDYVLEWGEELEREEVR